MFEQFPKRREALPSAYADIYEQHYKSNREGASAASGAAQRLEQWLHKKIAKDIKGLKGLRTLEIGAGTLNQITFEQRYNRESLVHYDVIEPFATLYKDSANLCYVRKIYADITEVLQDSNANMPITGGGGR